MKTRIAQYMLRGLNYGQVAALAQEASLIMPYETDLETNPVDWKQYERVEESRDEWTLYIAQLNNPWGFDPDYNPYGY